MKVLGSYIVVGLITLISLNGCNTSLDLFDESKALYSVYSSHDMMTSIQFIRIKDMNRTLEDEMVLPFSGIVELNNLNSGNPVLLRDSVIIFDGVTTHNFYTTNIEYETSYLLKVTRYDGAELSVRGTTPSDAEIQMSQPMQSCNTPLLFKFYQIYDLREVDLNLRFARSNRNVWLTEKRLGENDTLFFETLLSDAISYSFADTLTCDQLDSNKIDLRWTHYGPDYFDYTFSDSIETPGGYGYFRYYYNSSTSREFTPPE